MNVSLVPNATDTTNTTGTTGQTSSSDSGIQTDDIFLQLLTEQLKAQSPFDPVDPTQFVGQLVQFNTLDQLIQIRQLLQQATGTTSTSGT
jgi:flagellar basal-body rod modification protein FlgD